MKCSSIQTISKFRVAVIRVFVQTVISIYAKVQCYRRPTPLSVCTVKVKMGKLSLCLTKKLQKLISLYCKMFGTKSNIVLMCVGQQVEHILNLHKEGRKVFELLFTMV